MNRIVSTLIGASALILGVYLPREAVAQTAKDLVGTWTLVSVTFERDGKKTDLYGPNPQGELTFDPNGRISFIVMRPDLPKFASNNRQAGTPEENKAVVQGSLAYFGTYSVDERAKTATIHIEGCSFPNWNGTEQKRSFTISGDELSWSTPSTSLAIGHRSGPLETSQVGNRCAPAKRTGKAPKRYRGTVSLDPEQFGRDAGRIAEEVITHLTGLVGSSIKVTPEVEAEVPQGALVNVVRTVTENSRTLRFTSSDSETE